MKGKNEERSSVLIQTRAIVVKEGSADEVVEYFTKQTVEISVSLVM